MSYFSKETKKFEDEINATKCSECGDFLFPALHPAVNDLVGMCGTCDGLPIRWRRPPPDLGVSVSDGLGIKDEVK